MPVGIGRRQFISALGVVAVWDLGATQRAHSETPLKPLRIGIVHPVSPKGVPPDYVAFVGRLRELGYIEGNTLTIDYINLEGHLDRYDEAMRELVRRGVDVIFALGQEDNLRAAMAATRSIPIVMLAIGFDPLAKGYVSSLGRPTGNVTGIYVLETEVIIKQLQLFKDAFPGRHTAFGFWDFDSRATWRAAAAAAPSLSIALAGVEFHDPPYDYEGGLQQVAPEFRGALFLPPSAVFTRDADRIVAFTLRHRMISCFYSAPKFVDLGGLMSYGSDYAAAARRAAELVDRIAHGAKPTDLPIEQSTRFTLRINLKTAKILGIKFSPTFLAIADQVIE